MGSVINSSVSARMTTSATSLGSSQGAGGGDFGDNTDRTNEVGTTGGRRIVEDDDELNVTVRDGTGRGLNGSGNSRQRTPIDTDAMERFWFPSVTEWYANLDKRNAATVVVLVYCNLINYMDRSTVAGMIEYIRNDESFAITSDKTLGLLQTAFVVFYTFTAPLFGYLGDRYPRKWIVGLGLTVWSLATLAGSFCTNFWLFMFFRAVVGVGEASYSTIAPAIISDLFVSDSRSKVLALFYFAVPVGTGLGYMVGSEVGQAAEDWRWGLRVTPFMGLLAVLLIVFVMTDPPRGGSEGGANLQAASDVKEDLMSLKRNKSFCLSTIAFTCVAFCVGALMWWGPNFAFYGAKASYGNRPGAKAITQADISYKFGIVMTLAGLLGVPGGSYVAQTLRQRIPNADPIVCGASLLMAVPVLYFGFITARYDIAWCYALTFLAGLLLNCNWAIVSDITLYIVIPSRRSFASATQILVSHAFGDAISPYLIGTIADMVKNAIRNNHIIPFAETFATVTNGTILATNQTVDALPRAIQEHSPEWYEMEFRALQYALFICCFFQTLGGFVFLVMSWYVIEDRDIAIEEARSLAGPDNSNGSLGSVENASQETAVIGDNEEYLDNNMDSETAPVVRSMFAGGNS